jgi:hypothetical protein
MSDFRTIQDYVKHQEDALAKLRWLQVTELVKQYGNDQDLGAEIRKLSNK